MCGARPHRDPHRDRHRDGKRGRWRPAAARRPAGRCWWWWWGEREPRLVARRGGGEGGCPHCWGVGWWGSTLPRSHGVFRVGRIRRERAERLGCLLWEMARLGCESTALVSPCESTADIAMVSGATRGFPGPKIAARRVVKIPSFKRHGYGAVCSDARVFVMPMGAACGSKLCPTPGDSGGATQGLCAGTGL